MSALFAKFRDCLSAQPTRSERKRAAILDAAVAEFQAQGFRDTSMDRIARTACVSKRTVYNHFESKEDLIRAIVSDLLTARDETAAITYDSSRSLEEQLLELVRQDVELLRDDVFIGMARSLLAETFSTPDLVRSAFDDAAQREHPLSRWIVAASADGRLAVDDTELATAQLKALLKGLIFWPRVVGYGKESTDKEVHAIVHGAVRMFLDHYARLPS